MNTPPTIGVLSPFVSGSYFGSVIRGAAEAVAEAGARLVAIQTSDPGVVYSDRPDYAPHPHAAAWEHLAGCIVVIDAATPSYLEAMRRTGKPLVLISKQLDGFECPTVQPDSKHGVREAMRHLIGHGHTKIAFVGLMHQDDVQERYAAYVEALAEAGIDHDPTLVFATVDNEERCGVEAGLAMMADGLRSTAVMAHTDINAIGIMKALTAAGLELPRDQAIVGFDDIEVATFMRPALSTIRQDFGALGRLAAGLLLDKLASLDVANGQHEALTSFVVRESCGCPNALTPSLPVTQAERSVVARQRGLEQALDRTLTADSGASGRAAVVAAAAAVIGRAIEAAAKCEDGPSDALLRESLEALYQRSPRNQTVRGVIEVARKHGAELVALRRGQGAQGVVDRIIRLTTMMSAIHSQDQFNATT